jgi:phage gp46-like protein
MTALQFQNNLAVGSGDTVNGKTLQQGDWLASVVYTSLFTDARATREQTPDWATHQGGYWGDSFNTRSLGSLLWTLKREKLISSVLLRAEQYCKEALEWLIDKNYVKKISVDVEAIAQHRAGIVIAVTQADGQPRTFDWELFANV